MIPATQSAYDVRTLSRFFIEEDPFTPSSEKTYNNCVADLNCVWHNENVYPHVPADQYAVVLAYRYEDEQYKVCYFNGVSFLGMDDDFPFDPDIWTYLPSTPPEKT